MLVEQRDHVVEDLGGALADLVGGEHGHRVGRGGVAVAGGAAEFGHRVGGDTEGVAADGRGGQAAASNAMPSATADALHEPQSPMPVTMTSQLAAISLTSSPAPAGRS